MVFRVSNTSKDFARSTNFCVKLAMPQRRCRIFNATLSPSNKAINQANSANFVSVNHDNNYIGNTTILVANNQR